MSTDRISAIRPIRTDEDHRTARARLESLLERLPKDAGVRDEIEVLGYLIDAYESEHFPQEVASPIDAIRFRLDQKGLVQKDLEPYIGSRARVSEIMSGKRKLSADMMRALHEGLGIPYEALMARPSTVDFSDVEVKPTVLARLKEIGANVGRDGVPLFLESAFGTTVRPALNRKTRTRLAKGKTDETALLLWQAIVLNRAREAEPKSFDREKFTEDTLRELARLSTREDGPRKAVKALSEAGILVIFVPTLPGTFLDGAAMLIEGKTPVIGMTLRHDRIDNFWFVLMHECAHILRDFDFLRGSGQAIFDEMDILSEEDIEKEADLVASRALIPDRCAGKTKDPYASNAAIESVAKCAGVHPAIAAGRWQVENSNYKKFSRMIVRGTLRKELL